MSTVKWRGNFTYRTVTPDSLKFSLPKARDDPSGSSSPPITSVCLGQSNFRGSTLDSLVITSPTTRVEPHGSVSARGCSDVQDRANVLPLLWFSLGCSTDHNTAALMIISHNFGCYTGKASLYAWNSFIPEDFSSVLVHLMAGLVMNSYPSFPGLIELIVPPEMIIPYGFLSRPPERSLWFADFSFLTIDTYFGIISVDYGMILAGDDIAAFWLRFAHRYAYREGELLLANPKQIHGCGEARMMIHVAVCSAFCSIAETASSLDMASVDLFRESYVTQEQQLSPENFLSHTILQLFSAHVLHGVYSSRILLQHSAVLQQPDIQVLVSPVGCKHACSFKELYLHCLQISGVNQHSELASHVTHLLTASYILSYLKNDSRFDSAYCLSKHHDVVYRSSEDEAGYICLTTASWELYWFCNLLRDLHMVASVLFFSDDQAALHSLNKLVYH